MCLGGKKKSSFYYDLWNIKYLSKFKWDDLTEEIGIISYWIACIALVLVCIECEIKLSYFLAAYKKAAREQKLALEISAAKRERDFYLAKVDQARAFSSIEERLKKVLNL